MLIERLLQNLSITVEPFALCEIERACRLALEGRDTVTVHFVLHGSGTVTVGRRTVAVGTHGLVLVPQGRRHVLSADRVDAGPVPIGAPPGLQRLRSLGPRGHADLTTVCGRLDARFGGGAALFGHLTEPIVLDFAGDAAMESLFDEMLTESTLHEPGSLTMLTALMNRCMVIVFRRLCGSEDCPLPWLDALEDDRMGTVLDLMLQHPEEPHSMETLAAAATMSRSAFAAEFRRHFGVPPMTFLRDVRLRRAAELLRDDKITVGAAAARVGFASRAHFSTAFRDYFGVPPGRFRHADSAPSDVNGTPR